LEIVHDPHDSFFKETFTDTTIVKSFLQNYLPEELLGIIDVEKLTPQKDSFIDEELKKSFSDLLVEVEIAGREGYVYFLFEHKSFPQRNIILQLMKYMAEIWETKMTKENTKLPITIPLVIYHGAQNWNIPMTLGELLDGFHDLSDKNQEYIPNYKYILYNLPTLDDAEIIGEARLRITLMLLKYAHTDDAEKILRIFSNFKKALSVLNDPQLEKQFFIACIIYVLSIRDDVTPEKISKNLSDEGRKIVMSVAEQLRKEGRKEGKRINRLEIAKKMLQSGMEDSQVIAFTGVSAEDVKQIKEELFK